MFVSIQRLEFAHARGGRMRPGCDQLRSEALAKVTWSFTSDPPLWTWSLFGWTQRLMAGKAASSISYLFHRKK
jgi:hypothetical protein